MGKMAIWILTIVGLAPSFAVAIAGISVLIAVSRTNLLKNHPSSESFFHDTYFMLGWWRVDFSPQYWSVAVLFTGVVMILVALIAILRP